MAPGQNALAHSARPSTKPGTTPPLGELELIGTSVPLLTVYDRLLRCAKSDAPVLLHGESGTGKERAAQAVHRRSARASGPFVAINCATLTEPLLRLELLGPGEDANGECGRHRGKIAAARNGTLFLNEIGDMPLAVQRHLVDVLEAEAGINAQGSRSLPVRLMAATRVPLGAALREGRFRADLYYQLNVLTIEIPPLRARREDILPLARAALREAEHERRVRGYGFTPAAVAALESHPWPGNVRELLAVIRRAIVFAAGSTIDVADLGIARAEDVQAGADRAGKAPGRDAEIRQALARNRFNIKRTAQELGMSRVSLYRLIERHGIAIVRCRPAALSERVT